MEWTLGRRGTCRCHCLQICSDRPRDHLCLSRNLSGLACHLARSAYESCQSYRACRSRLHYNGTTHCPR